MKFPPPSFWILLAIIALQQIELRSLQIKTSNNNDNATKALVEASEARDLANSIALEVE